LENAVGMFFPVEVFKTVELLLVLYKLLVLTNEISIMFAENSFLTFGLDVLAEFFVNVKVRGQGVRAEEAFTVLFFLFVAGLGTLLEEFYCLVVRVTQLIKIFGLA